MGKISHSAAWNAREPTICGARTSCELTSIISSRNIIRNFSAEWSFQVRVDAECRRISIAWRVLAYCECGVIETNNLRIRNLEPKLHARRDFWSLSVASLWSWTKIQVVRNLVNFWSAWRSPEPPQCCFTSWFLLLSSCRSCWVRVHWGCREITSTGRCQVRNVSLKFNSERHENSHLLRQSP